MTMSICIYHKKSTQFLVHNQSLGIQKTKVWATILVEDKILNNLKQMSSHIMPLNVMSLVYSPSLHHWDQTIPDIFCSIYKG